MRNNITHRTIVHEVSRWGRQLWEEGHGEVQYGSSKDVCQALARQGLDIALVEAHRAASQYAKVHEDYRKDAAVMATAKPLSLSEC